MAILLSNQFANTLLGKSTTAGVAEQFASGTLVIYSGTPPDGPNEAIGQHATNTALATFTFSAAASWGSATGGIENLVFASQTAVASASGTAVFFRIIDSGSNALVQGTVGAGGADFNLTSVAVVVGDNVTITGTPTAAWTVT